ncbi:UNKNOWN [Stylonychia lemnae]|uniref:Ef hand family protein n=1 Tax=Stylonychia lemnae TaxID=5949 RepID=A0A078A9E2_STYLE|nr:UNKNOWN [Stylonychia lemnae]|eukprot:CDW78217.1 UNKNOWN [Stylonychia lemnae]
MKLMQLLDKKKLEALKKEFESFPEGLELSTFIWLMLCVLEFKEDEKFEIVQGLAQLFSEVDINDDKHMEWSEFTQYIIDSVMMRKAGREGPRRKKPKEENSDQKESILNASFEIDMPNGGGMEEEYEEEDYESNLMNDSSGQVSVKQVKPRGRGQAHIILSQSDYRHFDHSVSIFDQISHQSPIIQSQYCDRLGGFLTIEEYSKQVKIYTPNGTEKDKITLNNAKQKVFAIAFTFSDKHNLIAFVTSDCSIEIFDYQNNVFIRYLKQIPTPCIQTGIWYLPRHDIWLSAGKDNKIHQWNISKYDDDPPSAMHKYSFGGHTDQIMDLVELKIPKCIATASLDKTIRLFNIEEKYLIKVLYGHETGIRKISYISNFGGFFCSVGHESSIYVWSPETVQNRPFIGKLKGHQYPVVDAKFLPKTTLLISIDERLMIRVFDVYTFECKQTIFPQSDKFVWYGKRFIFFDTTLQEQQQRKFYKDEIYPMKVLMNKYHMSFYVVTKYDVRVIDAKSGLLLKVLDQIVNHDSGIEIADFDFDHSYRKFYVADTAGNVKCFNSGNCLLLKEESLRKPYMANDQKAQDQGMLEYYRGQSSKNEIIEIHYDKVKEAKLFYTIDSENNIITYDEDSNENFQFLRMAYNNPQQEISTMTLSSYHGLIATGCASGLICVFLFHYQLFTTQLWDYESAKLEAVLMQHEKDILTLVFPQPQYCLISASNDGEVCFWGLKHSQKYKYQVFKKFQYTYYLDKTNLSSTVLVKIDQQSKLIFGDEQGNVQKINITDIFQQAKYRRLEMPGDDMDKYLETCLSKVHNRPISFMRKLDDLDCIVTASSDGYFKILSTKDLSFLCIVDIHNLKKKPKQWDLPIDWISRKKEELIKVKNVLEEIEPNVDQTDLFNKMIIKNKIDVPVKSIQDKIFGGGLGSFGLFDKIKESLSKKSLLKQLRRKINANIFNIDQSSQQHREFAEADDDIINEDQAEFKRKIDEIFKQDTPTYSGFAKELQKMLNKLYTDKTGMSGSNGKYSNRSAELKKRYNLLSRAMGSRLQNQKQVSEISKDNQSNKNDNFLAQNEQQYNMKSDRGRNNTQRGIPLNSQQTIQTISGNTLSMSKEASQNTIKHKRGISDFTQVSNHSKLLNQDIEESNQAKTHVFLPRLQSSHSQAMLGRDLSRKNLQQTIQPKQRTSIISYYNKLGEQKFNEKIGQTSQIQEVQQKLSFSLSRPKIGYHQEISILNNNAMDQSISSQQSRQHYSILKQSTLAPDRNNLNLTRNISSFIDNKGMSVSELKNSTIIGQNDMSKKMLEFQQGKLMRKLSRSKFLMRMAQNNKTNEIL